MSSGFDDLVNEHLNQIELAKSQAATRQQAEEDAAKQRATRADANIKSFIAKMHERSIEPIPIYRWEHVEHRSFLTGRITRTEKRLLKCGVGWRGPDASERDSDGYPMPKFCVIMTDGKAIEVGGTYHPTTKDWIFIQVGPWTYDSLVDEKKVAQHAAGLIASYGH